MEEVDLGLVERACRGPAPGRELILARDAPGLPVRNRTRAGPVRAPRERIAARAPLRAHPPCRASPPGPFHIGTAPGRHAAVPRARIGDVPPTLDSLMTLARFPNRALPALLLVAAAPVALAQDAGDDAPPSAPEGLFANPYSATAAGVAWRAADDDVGIAGYEVTLDGEVVQQGDARSYIDFELEPATTYRVGVTAIDTAGQRSAPAFVEFSTRGAASAGPAPAAAPAPVGGLRANVYSTTALGLIWTRPDAPGLRYEVSRDGEALGETDGVTFVDTGLVPGRYVYEIVAIDRGGARSEPARIEVSTVDEGDPDGAAEIPDGEAPAPDAGGEGGDVAPAGNSVLDVIARAADDGTESLDALVSLLSAFPELAEALDDETATFTVFAPTDEAIAASGADALDPEALEEVIAYHGVPGTAFNAMALEAGTSFPVTLETAQGGTVEIVDDGDGSLSVVDAAGTPVALDRIIDSASNGVVYVIDAVLSPPAAPDGDAAGNADDDADGEVPDGADPATPGVQGPADPAGDGGTILDVAGEAEGLGTLVSVLGGYPDLVELLGDGSAELLVFAPTDDAFAAADLGGLDAAAVRNVLEYHVVPGATVDLSASDDGAASSVTLITAQGATLELVASGPDRLSVIDSAGNAVPVEATVDTASNGTVFVVGSVLAAPPLAP